MFRLSNDMIQGIFNNKSEIMVINFQNQITFVSKLGLKV